LENLNGDIGDLTLEIVKCKEEQVEGAAVKANMARETVVVTGDRGRR